MEYGLIGEHLPHSFSKEIHQRIGAYDYVLRELIPEEVPDFMQAADFRGINVTIPYKQTVIPYLDEISPRAQEIGAVNTVVNRDGRLVGFNTDFEGMQLLIERMGLSLAEKKVMILGTGGTSKTAAAVAKALGAASIWKVSRSAMPELPSVISYEEAVSSHKDAQVIINTTPCGMYPHADATPIDLTPFTRLEGVVDVIYNPLKTRLVLQAEDMGIKASGGLYMLVAQALCAAEHFLREPLPKEKMEEIFQGVEKQKQNMVLLGTEAIPLGQKLAEKMGRPWVDVATVGLQEAAALTGVVLSMEGSAAEDSSVLLALRQNGIFIPAGGENEICF